MGFSGGEKALEMEKSLGERLHAALSKSLAALRGSKKNFTSGSVYARLEAFRRVAISGTDDEAVYAYIAGFNTENSDVIAQFLEILTDFLLPTAYVLRHRASRVIIDGCTLPRLLGLLDRSTHRDAALVALGILAGCAEIAGADLSPIASLLATAPSERTVRRCLRVLARGTAAGARIDARSLATLRTVEASRNVATQCDIESILACATAVPATLDTHILALTNGALAPAPPGFWARHAASFDATSTVTDVLALLAAALCSRDQLRVLAAAYDLLAILCARPDLTATVQNTDIPEALLSLVDSANEEDLCYTAVQVLSILFHGNDSKLSPP